MKKFIRHSAVLVLSLFSLILMLLPISGIFPGPGIALAKITPETVLPDQASVKAVMAVQERHTPDLLGIPGVVGTATGVTEGGSPAVLILGTDSLAQGALPRDLEGVPVILRVTGEITAMKRPPGKGPGGSESKVDPKTRFTTPVPIGVSTGNWGECSSGTIGARVYDGVGVYALSNNHVFALENDALLGSYILQPGRYDMDCSTDLTSYETLGTLEDYEAFDFSGAPNTIDAAIAASSEALLGNGTPSDGYGIPKSTPVVAELGLAVQKYGRTTSLTQGEIVGINATVNVGYGSGTALFVKQILVGARKPFIKPGDSGSLLVSSNRDPVGLLFAGNSTGKTAVANLIDLVLERFGVSIDGDEN